MQTVDNLLAGRCFIGRQATKYVSFAELFGNTVRPSAVIEKRF
jgi:hypothetical protein